MNNHLEETSAILNVIKNMECTERICADKLIEECNSLLQDILSEEIINISVPEVATIYELRDKIKCLADKKELALSVANSVTANYSNIISYNEKYLNKKYQIRLMAALGLINCIVILEHFKGGEIYE